MRKFGLVWSAVFLFLYIFKFFKFFLEDGIDVVCLILFCFNTPHPYLTLGKQKGLFKHVVLRLVSFRCNGKLKQPHDFLRKTIEQYNQ